MLPQARQKRGDAVGPYQLVAAVARGGMGTVFAARQRTRGFERLVALKLLHPHFASEARFVAMLLDEARIAARIDHPNVVRILDVVEHDGAPLVVMELLQGRSFAELLARTPDLPREIVYAILARAAAGLDAAHAAVGEGGEPLGVVHRDVSPHNVHVGFDGRVKLVDFGIAAARGRLASTRTGEVKGKLAYLAPEQITQGTIDRRTDLFAFGVVAFEAITATRLFRQDDEASTMWAVMHREVPPLASVTPGVPDDVARLVARCLARPMHERPASAGDLVPTLLAAAGDTGEAEIAAFMQRTFADDMRADQEILEGRGPDALGDALAQTGSRSGTRPREPVSEGATAATRLDLDATNTSATGDVPVPAKPASKTRWIVGGGLAVVAALAAAFALTRGGASPGLAVPAPPATTTVVSADVSAAPAATSAAPPIASAPVSFGVGAGVRLVLVDGTKHDERPVVVHLAPGASASVSLVTKDGRIVERSVSAADDGTVLELAAPAGGGPRVGGRPLATSSPAASAAGDGKPPLWKSPYAPEEPRRWP